MLEQHFAERTQFGARVRGTGRVAGRVQQQQARLRRDRRFELAGRDLVTLRGGGIRRDRQAIGEHDHVRIGHPVRRRDHGLVARIEQGHAEVVDRLLRAGGDQDLRAVVGQSVVPLELRDDRVLEFRDPAHIRIAREAGAHGGDAGIGDMHRRIEIRLTRAKADDVLALGLQFRGARGDGEGGGRLDALDAAGDGYVHGSAC